MPSSCQHGLPLNLSCDSCHQLTRDAMQEHGRQFRCLQGEHDELIDLHSDLEHELGLWKSIIKSENTFGQELELTPPTLAARFNILARERDDALARVAALEDLRTAQTATILAMTEDRNRLHGVRQRIIDAACLRDDVSDDDMVDAIARLASPSGAAGAEAVVREWVERKEGGA